MVQILEKRIHHGDYLLQEIPAERELAKEVGVSRETVRKAVSGLIDRGLLRREANGRILASESFAQSQQVRRIAFLSNSFPNPYAERWYLDIVKLADQRGWHCRRVAYHHLDDPLIDQTLGTFDGTFFLPGEQLTPRLKQMLKQSPKPLVMLNNDFSAEGLVSLWLSSPLFVRSLFEYLYEMGHRNVACLNTQAMNVILETWIGQWEQWKLMNHCQGQLINHPVEPYEFTEDRAYEVIRQMLKDGDLDCTALFCTTGSMAVAATRALHEAGLVVGKDISVCSATSHTGLARYLTPSLTCLLDVEPGMYLNVCLDWMDHEGDNWVGPLLLEPHEPRLFKGESVGRFSAVEC